MRTSLSINGLASSGRDLLHAYIRFTFSIVSDYYKACQLK